MPTDPQNPRSPAPGLHATLESLKAQASRYLGARLALVRLEAEEAARDAGTRAISGSVGAVLLVFSYLLLLAGIIGLAEHYFPGCWPFAALAAAGLHLAVGLPLLMAATKKRPKPLFGESLNQLKEDEQWMRQMSHRPETPAPKN